MLPAARTALVATLIAVAAMLALLPASTLARPRLEWRQDLATALSESRQAGRLAVIRFDADWCPICDRLERSTLGDRDVATRLADFELVLVDVTETTPAKRRLMEYFGVGGVPALLFVSRRGLILDEPRITGYVDPQRLLAVLDELVAREEPNQVATLARRP